MAKELNRADAEPILRHLKMFALGIGAFFTALVVYAVYLDQRIDTLNHSSPGDLAHEEQGRSDLYHLAANPVEGQTVYVPAYSHIYHGKGDPFLLTITLSVRNTSVEREIVVKSVRYFDTKGRMVKSYLTKPVRLPALGTTEVVVTRDDTSGGSGANFLVEWHASQPVTEPIIEAIMIATDSQQGISFARRGSVISVAVAKGKPQPEGKPAEKSP